MNFAEKPKYSEDLRSLEGFTVGIDAETLLQMVTESKPFTSLQTSNDSLDTNLL